MFLFCFVLSLLSMRSRSEVYPLSWISGVSRTVVPGSIQVMLGVVTLLNVYCLVFISPP